MVHKTRVSRELLSIGFKEVSIVSSPAFELLVLEEDNGDEYYIRWHPDDPLNLYIDFEPVSEEEHETAMCAIRAFFKQLDINDEKVACLRVYKYAEKIIKRHTKKKRKTKQVNKDNESNNEMPESTGSGSLLS